MTKLVYNIPARLIDKYRGRNLIVRSDAPDEIVRCLEQVSLENLRFIQLLSTPADVGALEGFATGLPVEIVLNDPVGEFPRLYNYTNLLDSHPVRIAITVVPGFSRAVKLASSLDFAVKLELDQPDSTLIEELKSVLSLYLHRSTTRRPVEFFHSLLQSFYHYEPDTIWDIAEENPGIVRYITEDGEETISRRFAGAHLEHSLDDYVAHFGQQLISAKRECHECEFFNRCGGYFKWPNQDYRCDNLRTLLGTLRSAANEVREDLARYERTAGV